jgi:hypothetical protein
MSEDAVFGYPTSNGTPISLLREEMSLLHVCGHMDVTSNHQHLHFLAGSHTCAGSSWIPNHADINEVSNAQTGPMSSSSQKHHSGCEESWLRPTVYSALLRQDGWMASTPQSV